MSEEKILEKLQEFINSNYPNMIVRIDKSFDKNINKAIYFEDEKFRGLYRQQKLHYLLNSIPHEFIDEHLAGNYVFYELAPGEKASELTIPDDQLYQNITNDVMKVLESISFYEKLDEVFMKEKDPGKLCDGSFQLAKKGLRELNMSDEEIDDVLGVLMLKGAYCDCEILLNVADKSRLKSEYWMERAKKGEVEVKKMPDKS